MFPLHSCNECSSIVGNFCGLLRSNFGIRFSRYNGAVMLVASPHLYFFKNAFKSGRHTGACYVFNLLIFRRNVKGIFGRILSDGLN